MAPLCVELKMLSGATVCLEVEETSSVHHLKSEFFQLLGIPRIAWSFVWKAQRCRIRSFSSPALTLLTLGESCR